MSVIGAAYQDAAFEEGVELVLNKPRQVGAGCRLGLLEEGAACCFTRQYSVVRLGRWRS